MLLFVYRIYPSLSHSIPPPYTHHGAYNAHTSRAYAASVM